jgi:glutamine synthetase adenylyltransferase
MGFVAERHSAFFRHTLNAWQGRAPAANVLAKWLGEIVGQPVTGQAIGQWLRRFEQLAGAGSVPEGAATAPALDGDRTARVLRQTRALLIMALCERDLSGRASLAEVCEAMSDFAQLTTERALGAAERLLGP